LGDADYISPVRLLRDWSEGHPTLGPQRSLDIADALEQHIRAIGWPFAITLDWGEHENAVE
jgi:hypothetical protein